MRLEIGERIKALREKRDWNQTALAKKIGVSKSVMSRIEAGRRPLEDTLLVKLVEVLDVSADYILGTEEKNEIHTEVTPLDKKKKQIMTIVNQTNDMQELDLTFEVIKKMLNK